MAPELARAVLAVLAALAVLLPAESRAFPTMIAHGYTGCAQCHLDPTGAGALTPYGRAQSEVLLRTRYGGEPQDPERTGAFLFGAVPVPGWAVLQGDLRTLAIPDPERPRLILMQADARGGFTAGPAVGYASIGVVSEGALGARLLRDGPAVVSREHWVGVRPSGAVLVRAGRMPLPFGVRTENHLELARRITRTDLNDDQQLGLAVGIDARGVRGELMAVAGNLAVSPDVFRERGVAGFVAHAPSNRLELGLSGLVLAAGADVDSLAPRTRTATGGFARWGPHERLAVLAELDLLADRAASAWALGGAGTLRSELEVASGVHLGASAEGCAAPGSAAVGRAGAVVRWFAAPHLDLRTDLLYGPLSCSPGPAIPLAALQLHAFL